VSLESFWLLKELATLEDLGHHGFGSESYWADSLGSDGMSRRLSIRILGAEEVSRHQMSRHQSKSWPLNTVPLLRFWLDISYRMLHATEHPLNIGMRNVTSPVFIYLTSSLCCVHRSRLPGVPRAPLARVIQPIILPQLFGPLLKRNQLPKFEQNKIRASRVLEPI
jgi:hypothetical protein